VTQAAVESPRRKPIQSRSRETVRAILQAAARILTDEGLEHASTNRVAKVAGVSIGTLYQYFDSRDAIVAALAREHADEMLGLLATFAGQAATMPPRRTIREFVAAMIEAHRVAPQLHVALVQQLLSQGSAEALAEIRDPGRIIVRAWLEQHRAELRPKDLDAAAFLLTTTVEAAIHAKILEDPEGLADLSWQAELVDLLERYALA